MENQANSEQRSLTSDINDLIAYNHVRKVFQYEMYNGLLAPIPNEMIMEAWKRNKNEPQNDYDEVVERGQFFEKYGLTPVYLTDPTGRMMIVTSEEHLTNKLH